MRKIKTLHCGEAKLAASKFRSLAEFWDECKRADWMMCLLVEGEVLTQSQAVKIAAAFARRTPARISRLWLKRVKKSKGRLDAAGEAWAASYASANYAACAENGEWDPSIFAAEMAWQAKVIRRAIGNPFRQRTSGSIDTCSGFWK